MLSMPTSTRRSGTVRELMLSYRSSGPSMYLACVTAGVGEHVGVAIDGDSERMQSKLSGKCGRMGCEGSAACSARNAP